MSDRPKLPPSAWPLPAPSPATLASETSKAGVAALDPRPRR